MNFSCHIDIGGTSFSLARHIDPPGIDGLSMLSADSRQKEQQAARPTFQPATTM
jgi:hypothetical protein